MLFLFFVSFPQDEAGPESRLLSSHESTAIERAGANHSMTAGVQKRQATMLLWCGKDGLWNHCVVFSRKRWWQCNDKYVREFLQQCFDRHVVQDPTCHGPVMTMETSALTLVAEICDIFAPGCHPRSVSPWESKKARDLYQQRTISYIPKLLA